MRSVFLTLALLAGWSLMWVGCERELSESPPPLRPLVYTEARPEDGDILDFVEEVEVVVAAEDLGGALYQALVEHDREAFESLFVTGPELVELIKMDPEKAAKRAESILEASDPYWALCLPSQASEEPVGGLNARIRLDEFRLGKGRDLSGKVLSDMEQPVQHWGNELRVGLRQGEKFFSLRVPKIVKTIHGWKIAEPLEMEQTLRLFLETGMHLKDELLTSEHYPFPYEVGNYWKYEISGAYPNLPSPFAEGEEEVIGLEPLEPITPTVKLVVTEVDRREGYLIVVMERDLFHGTHRVTTERLLVTPRRIYPCAKDCYQNRDDVGYLLGYASRQTPRFVFPLKPGIAWDKNGERKPSRNRYHVQDEIAPLTQVPAGDFSDAVVVVGSISAGREERIFIPGTGVVLRTVRSGSGSWSEHLLDYRLML